MKLTWLLAFLALIGSASVFHLQDNAEQTQARDDVPAIAYNLFAYRNALAEYARTNPTFTGAPADSVLAWPTWYRKVPNVSGYMSAGQSFTYQEVSIACHALA